MPNSVAVVGQLGWTWAAAIRSAIGRRAIVGRDRVIRGRHGLARVADLEPALAQPGERLRAGDLVDQVQVDRQDARRAGLLVTTWLSQILSTRVRGCWIVASGTFLRLAQARAW
jgi:hypothetical protein